VLQTKVYEIPVASRTAKGRAIHNFLELPPDERVSAIVSYNPTLKNQNVFLVMVTKDGVIKKTAIQDFANIRRTGIIAVNLKKGDALTGVKVSHGKDHVVLVTAKGQAIRFKESQVRAMGRTASGIRGIKLRGDRVAGFDIMKDGKESVSEARLLVVMANGFGKQTPLREYKVQNRGGSGIRTANVTPKTGQVVAAQIVQDEEEILALSAKGQVIRTKLASVRMTGRAAQGVRIMNVKAGDRLAGVVVI
jgi:DNA gyrase subunit A